MLRLLLLFRNARPWLRRCLMSIYSQSVAEWHCHAVDDLSDDGSWELVQQFVASDRRFTLVRNSQRLYQCGSSRRILDNPNLDDHDICVAIDGDDYLPDPFVFQRVLEAYSDGKTWVTWGSEIRTDGVPDCNGPLEDVSILRKVPWRTSHLRTWKLFLWRRIRGEDFLDPDGHPLRVGGDLASMYPMIEMAGIDRVKYLPTINYVYNRDNPLNNFRVRTKEQLNNGEFLKSKLPYSRLPDSLETVIFQKSTSLSATTDTLNLTLPLVDSKKNKIFGIGLSGTEPENFDRALWSLGYRTIVNPPLLAVDEVLRKYNSATSESIAFRFRELDRRYPGSKFVLTVCDSRDWLAATQFVSREDQISPPWEREIRQTLYGTTGWEPEQLLVGYDQHVNLVGEYFSARSEDLLVLNAKDSSWLKQLRDFLAAPVASHRSTSNTSPAIPAGVIGEESL